MVALGRPGRPRAAGWRVVGRPAPGRHALRHCPQPKEQRWQHQGRPLIMPCLDRPCPKMGACTCHGMQGAGAMPYACRVQGPCHMHARCRGHAICMQGAGAMPYAPHMCRPDRRMIVPRAHARAHAPCRRSRQERRCVLACYAKHLCPLRRSTHNGTNSSACWRCTGSATSRTDCLTVCARLTSRRW